MWICFEFCFSTVLMTVQRPSDRETSFIVLHTPRAPPTPIHARTSSSTGSGRSVMRGRGRGKAGVAGLRRNFCSTVARTSSASSIAKPVPTQFLQRGNKTSHLHEQCGLSTRPLSCLGLVWLGQEQRRQPSAVLGLAHRL
jgi:hypothetical protein